jgi:hypothetical protein
MMITLSSETPVIVVPVRVSGTTSQSSCECIPQNWGMQSQAPPPPAAATSQQLSGAWRSDERHTNNSHYDSSAPPPTSLTPLSSCLVQRNSTAPPRYQRK